MRAGTTILKLLTTLTLASSAAAISPPQFINAVWSSGSFETVGDKYGNEIGHSGGFSLIDANGNTIYTNDAPLNHATCYTEKPGRKFKVTHGCFGERVFEFQCRANFDGSPGTCTVRDSNGDSLGSAKGNEKDKFIGIAITQSGYCGVNFPLPENTHCDPNSKGFTVS